MEEDEELAHIREKKLAELKKRVRKQASQKAGLKEATLLELNFMNFDKIVQNSPQLLVDCWAEWCMPCRMMDKIFQKLAKEFRGKITFGKLNTDENVIISSRYDISGVPSFLVFKKGQFLKKFVGAVGEPVLRKVIQQFFN